MIRIMLGLFLWFPLAAFAHLISITATSPFPANTLPSSTKVAVFTVTNTTSRANVTIVDQSQFPSGSGLSILKAGSTCPGTVLTPGASCTIQVQLIAPATTQTISGELREWASPTADGVQYPISVNVTNSISNQFAYAPNAGGIPNQISLCQISASNGSLSNCTTTTTINAVGGMTILGNFAYFGSSNASGLVDVCSINSSTGALTNCSTSGSSFNGPYAINFNPAGNLAYIANNGNSTVTFCAVSSSTGALSSCTTTGSTFSAPLGVVLNPSGSFAYITNSNNNTVTLCTVNSSTGALSGCGTTGSGFNYPWGITMNAAGSLVYITNLNNNTVSLCSVNTSTGALNNCTATGSNFNSPNGIALNAAGTLAYVTNYNLSTATLCLVNSSTGALSGCSSTGSGFNNPDGIALY